MCPACLTTAAFAAAGATTAGALTTLSMKAFWRGPVQQEHAVRYRAVIAAAVLSFVSGGLWYSPLLFGGAWLALRGVGADAMAATSPSAGSLVAEFLRGLLVAYVLARFVVRLQVADWRGAVRLAFWIWLGFQALAIAGSVIHEGYAWQLYAIHAGDALVKTVSMSVLLSLWHRPSITNP